MNGKLCKFGEKEKKKKAVGFSSGNEELINILIFKIQQNRAMQKLEYLFPNQIAASIWEVIFALAYFTNLPQSF